MMPYSDIANDTELWAYLASVTFQTQVKCKKSNITQLNQNIYTYIPLIGVVSPQVIQRRKTIQVVMKRCLGEVVRVHFFTV